MGSGAGRRGVVPRTAGSALRIAVLQRVRGLQGGFLACARSLWLRMAVRRIAQRVPEGAL